MTPLEHETEGLRGMTPAQKLAVMHALSESERHLRDVAMMVRISGDIMDKDALQSRLSTLGLEDVFLVAQRYVPT